MGSNWHMMETDSPTKSSSNHEFTEFNNANNKNLLHFSKCILHVLSSQQYTDENRALSNFTKRKMRNRKFI